MEEKYCSFCDLTHGPECLALKHIQYASFMDMLNIESRNLTTPEGKFYKVRLFRFASHPLVLEMLRDGTIPTILEQKNYKLPNGRMCHIQFKKFISRIPAFSARCEIWRASQGLLSVASFFRANPEWFQLYIGQEQYEAVPENDFYR